MPWGRIPKTEKQ